MAEGKNGVIVYKDWITTFEDLTDEEAGRLIKHFFRYVNDQNPEAPDRITRLMFEPFKRQLKSDLKRWEAVCERNRNNGAKGGRPKKEPNPTETEKTQSVILGLNKTQSNPNKPDTDTDTDNDIDRDKEKNNTIGDKPPKPSKPKKPEFDLSFVEPQFKDCFTEWLEYKRGRKQSYKTQESLQKCYNTLVKYANGNKETAAEIIDSSIANNYSGFFEPKQKPQTYKHPFSEQVNNKHHENF